MKKGHMMRLGGTLLPILLLGALALPQQGQAASLFFGDVVKERKAEIENLASQAQGVLTKAASLRKNLKDQILTEIQELDVHLETIYDEAVRLQENCSDDLDEFEMLLHDLEQKEQELQARQRRDRLKSRCEETMHDFCECEDRFEVHRSAAWNLMFEPDGTEPVSGLTYAYHHLFDPLRDSMQGEHQYLSDEKKEFDWMVKNVDAKIDSMRRARRELTKIRDRMNLEVERMRLEAELKRLIDILSNPVLIQNIHSLPGLIQKIEELLQDPRGLSPDSLSELTQKVEELLQDRQGLSPEMIMQLEDILKHQSASESSKMQVVTFFLPGGHQFKTIKIVSGKGVPRPTKAPEKDGYEFLYWSKEGSEEPFEFGTALPNDVSALNLHARFKKLSSQAIRSFLPVGRGSGEAIHPEDEGISGASGLPGRDGDRIAGRGNRGDRPVDQERKAGSEHPLRKGMAGLSSPDVPVAVPSSNGPKLQPGTTGNVAFEAVERRNHWSARAAFVVLAIPLWMPWTMDALLFAGWLGLLFFGFRRP